MVVEQSVLAVLRRGVLYNRVGSREIGVVCSRDLTVEVIAAIQRFRGTVYAQRGNIPAVEDGYNRQAGDWASDHVILIDSDRLIGCARYEIKTSASAEVAGFVVDPAVRQGRATILVVEKLKQLAYLRRPRRITARACVESGAASIAKKCGGTATKRYYEQLYERTAEQLEFVLQNDTADLLTVSLIKLSHALCKGNVLELEELMERVTAGDHKS